MVMQTNQEQILNPDLTRTAMQPISTVIIAQNEEECIANAILSCRSFSDEIVVIDSGSQDRTVEIAESLGCRVYHNPWPGYASQRNFGAAKASHDWIFFIDADEVVDQALAANLLDWKLQANLTAKAFTVFRIGDFWGQWLDSKPEVHIRLYNKQICQFDQVLVHEKLKVEPEKIAHLSGIIWHYGFRDVSDLVIRFNRYTDLDAKQSYLEGRRFNLFRLLLKPIAKFFQQYLWCGMYRQGIAGLALAGLWSYYIFLEEIKLYDLKWQANQRKD